MPGPALRLGLVLASVPRGEDPVSLPRVATAGSACLRRGGPLNVYVVREIPDDAAARGQPWASWSGRRLAVRRGRGGRRGPPPRAAGRPGLLPPGGAPPAPRSCWIITWSRGSSW